MLSQERKREEEEKKKGSEADAEELPNTLVLGMVYLEAHELDSIRRPTQSSAWRDTVRLQRLESLRTNNKSSYRVFSMNCAHTSRPGRHHQGFFSERGIKDLARSIRAQFGERFVFSYILVDYIRMYGQYFDSVFESFESKVLPQLVQTHLMNKDTVLFVPHRPAFFKWNECTVTPLKALDHPLYCATQMLEDESVDLGICNADNLQSFDKQYPFVSIQLHA